MEPEFAGAVRGSAHLGKRPRVPPSPSPAAALGTSEPRLFLVPVRAAAVCRAAAQPGPGSAARAARPCSARDQRTDPMGSAGKAPGRSGSALSSSRAAARASPAPRGAGRVDAGLAPLVSAAAPWPGGVRSYRLRRRLGLTRVPPLPRALLPAGLREPPLRPGRAGPRQFSSWAGDGALAFAAAGSWLLRRNAERIREERLAWGSSGDSEFPVGSGSASCHLPQASVAPGTAQRVPLAEQRRHQLQCSAARPSLRRQRTTAQGPEHLLGVRRSWGGISFQRR